MISSAALPKLAAISLTRSIILCLMAGLAQFAGWETAAAQTTREFKIPCYKMRGIVPAKGGKIFGIATRHSDYYPVPGTDSSSVFMLDRQGNMLWNQCIANSYVTRFNVYADTARGRYFLINSSGVSNYYESQQSMGVACYSDSGRLVWSEIIGSTTTFCQTGAAIDSATGDLLVAGLDGSSLLIDIITGRKRANCLIRLSGNTGQLQWSVKEPSREAAGDFQLESANVVCLSGSRTLFGTTSWVYNFIIAKWETKYRFTLISAQGNPVGQSKLFQIDNPSGLAIASLAKSKDGGLTMLTSYVTTLVGRFAPYYPAVYKFDRNLNLVSGRYYEIREGAKSVAPNSNLLIDPVTGDAIFSTFISDTITGGNPPLWEGYLRVSPTLAVRKLKRFPLGYLPRAADARMATFGQGRLAIVIGYGYDSARSLVYLDTAGNGCAAYRNDTVTGKPVTGLHAPTEIAYNWEPVTIYVTPGGASPYSEQLRSIASCGSTGQPPARTKRLPRDTTVCAGGLTLRWPKSSCCTTQWSTGETTDEITVFESDTIIVQDVGECSSQPEADTMVVTFNRNALNWALTPLSQNLCPGDSAKLSVRNLRPGGILHWTNDASLPMFDTAATASGLFVPRSLSGVPVIQVRVTARFGACSNTRTARIFIANLPGGRLVTTDSVYFFADTRDSVALWTVTSGTFGPGPVRNSIRAQFDTGYGIRTVTALLVNGQGCDSLLTFNYTRVRPTVLPPDRVPKGHGDNEPRFPKPPIPEVPQMVLKPEIYNVVTPNADGRNDAFTFRDLGTPPYQLSIYSRWGRLIFKSPDYRMDFPDLDVPAGTYFYNLTVEGKTYKGWMEIVR